LTRRDEEGDMGMVLRFPIERARLAPAGIADEPAKVLILPTIRIERGEDEPNQSWPGLDDHSGEPGSGSGRRRRTPRS
jgi:hypothetical protein